MGGLGLGLGLGVGNEVRAVCPTLGFGVEELGVGLGACVTEGFGDFGCFGLGLGAGLGLGLRPWSGEWGKLKVADTSLHVDLRGELGVVVVLV